MESKKSTKKHRSYVDAQKESGAGASERPPLQSRSHSASVVTGRRQSASKSQDSFKHSSPSDGDSRGSRRDDTPFSSTYSSSRLAESERLKAQASRSREDVVNQRMFPQVNLVVLGASSVGKSTFVQRALDLRQPPQFPTTSKKMSLDGIVYLVKLSEIPLEDISIADDARVVWPDVVGGDPMLSVDGVLSLIDVSDRESIVDVSGVLKALASSEVPCVLVSCKYDLPAHSWQIERSTVERLSRTFGLETYETSVNSADSQKKCISILLRSILNKLPESPRPRASTSPRRRANTSIKPPTLPMNQTDISGSKQHIRAKSEIQRSRSSDRTDRSPTANSRRQDRSGVRNLNETTTSSSTKSSQRVQTAPSSRRNSRPSQPQTPHSSLARSDGDAKLPTRAAEREHTPPPSPIAQNRQSIAPSIKSLSAFNSFLNMEDEESLHEMEMPPSPDAGKAKGPEKQTEVGFSFDELVDRLLAQPMSKQDSKFAAIFLCLYRKFAAPYQLLSAIITRFETLDKPNKPQLTRVGEQFRYLNILGQWVSDYPGDFAHPTTRQRMAGFMRKLERSRVFSYAASTMKDCVETAVEDDDAGWACHDTDAVPSQRKQFAESSDDDDEDEDDTNFNVAEDASELSPQSSTAPSYTSLPGKSGSTSNHSLSMLFTAESAQREASSLYPVPRYPLTKTVWRQFMEIPEEDFARELTRIDWILYCSIRPRDFVRHVSLPSEQSLKAKSLENVNRMIAQFNRLAYFITNIILLRDKPKHRAQAMEKCKSIAWKLRQMNNYNSLGAMIASIGGSAVTRLAQTRDLIAPNVRREFMRLEILMNPRRSYSAYRLAWENSFAERIPFVPLHRRDLVSAEEGSKTWVGENNDRINWRKFEIMGEVIIGIQKSQATPYTVINKNEDVRKLFLETKFTVDEEELYERSTHVEPPGVGEARKKFGLFRS